MTAATPPSSGYGSPYSSDNAPRSNRSSTANAMPANGARHLDDIVWEANARAESVINQPIGHVVNAASESARFAETLLTHRRRDQAFLEYLLAMNIATDVVVRHRDWQSFRSPQNQHSTLYRSYRQTLERLNMITDQFDKIKQIIIMENQRTGILPRSRTIPSMQPQSRPSSQQGPRSSSRLSDRPDDMFPDARSREAGKGMRPSSSDYSDFAALMDSNSTTSLSRNKPQIRPKPEAMQGRAIPPSLAAGPQTNGGMPDLAARFARLRPTSLPPAPYTNGQQQSQPASGRVDSVVDSYQPPKGIGAATMSSTQSRPAGPRDLPSVPPKLPLDTAFAMSMPQPPSAAYSPARNMQTPQGVDPPRSTARSTVRSASSASVSAPGNADASSYFPRTNTSAGHSDGRNRRKGSIGLPSEGRGIEAKILLDYMSLYKILLIDVRDRRVYDEGHIDSTGTICISPECLRENMTDEDLERATLLSPDSEMALFSKRDQVDLVVYYDQNTQTPGYLYKAMRTPQEDALRYLFDALWEVNVARTPKRAPLLLLGGLDAWANLLGTAALRTSNTTEMTGIKARAPTRKPIPAPSPAALLAMEKRRRREYNPLDAEEERQWQESARKESIYIPTEEESEDQEGESSFYRTQEDFLRRFPAIHAESQSMTEAMPRRRKTPPGAPNLYTADVTQQPTFPSRPAPAAPRVEYGGAHDLSDRANANNAHTQHQQLQPYVSPREMPQNIRLPKTGLHNFGVTCYMNAVIQCLSATIPLSQQFRNDNYSNYLQRENWKGARGLFPQHFANLVKHLWLGDVQAVKATTFRDFCARLDSKYGIYQQQDAKEFLEFAMDYLHEDLNINWKNNPPHVLTKEEEEMRERLPKGYAALIEWSRYCKRSKSLIQDLFAGQHYSQIRCQTCGHTSTTYEAFLSISVEIPRSDRIANISDCLRSYCKEELLTGADMPKCEKCNEQRPHTKKITLTRAPRYLIVHFKRFTSSLAKISTPITFPLTNLDITPHVLPPLSSQDRQTVLQNTNDASFLSRSMDECMTPPYLYNAYAVVKHLGKSLGSGHYIALARDPGRGCWRVFDDDKGRGDVSANAANVIGGAGEVYVAFFERVQTGGAGGSGTRVQQMA